MEGMPPQHPDMEVFTELPGHFDSHYIPVPLSFYTSRHPDLTFAFFLVYSPAQDDDRISLSESMGVKVCHILINSTAQYSSGA